jgi:uncharacterized membrane protein (DUF485 family)
MQQPLVDKIKNLPEYHSLVKERGRLAWSLSATMLAAYFGFILVVAFKPTFFKTIVWGNYITIGFPLGVGLILLAFVLTGIYVRRANQRFDVLTDKIKEAVK